jgi:hypothetical protein
MLSYKTKCGDLSLVPGTLFLSDCPQGFARARQQTHLKEDRRNQREPGNCSMAVGRSWAGGKYTVHTSPSKERARMSMWRSGSKSMATVTFQDNGSLHFDLYTLYYIIILGWDWGLHSGLLTCKAGALMLEPLLQSILLWFFWRWGSWELFARTGLKLWPSWSQPPK